MIELCSQLFKLRKIGIWLLYILNYGIKDAQRFYEKADSVLIKKINRCLELLKNNPSDHPNIKSLKGPLAGYYRCRLGDWRVVYRIEEIKKQVIILLIVHRKNAYR